MRCRLCGTAIYHHQPYVKIQGKGFFHAECYEEISYIFRKDKPLKCPKCNVAMFREQQENIVKFTCPKCGMQVYKLVLGV